jgi:Tfp pilus assembly protein PilN
MATTALMPLDPAPQQINRVLTIRANLLPSEISIGRDARRMRGGVLVALVVVLGLLVAWYGYAYHQKTLADADLAAMTRQVGIVRDAENQKKFQEVTTVKNQNDTITTQLKTLLAGDLPWSGILDDLRGTAAKSGVTITSISAAVADKQSASSASLPSATGKTTVFTLVIAGTAKDKKTIAKYIDALGGVAGVANPYLTAATQNTDGVSFLADADVTSSAVCGRWTKPCATGGK